MKIIYLIAGTYRAAGMERVLAQKANWLAEHGHELLIVTTDQQGREPAFELNPAIRTADLAIGYEDNNGASFLNKLIHFPGKQRRHRKLLTRLLKAEKADITVSMFCNDAAFLPKIKDGSRKVLEIHFSRYKRLQYGRKGLWAIADKLMSAADLRAVRRFHKFVVLTEEDRGYWGNLPNMEVIPNGRTFSFSEPAALNNHQVLAVGRYCHQKGFDRLLRIWRLLGGETSKWTLRIAGSGEDLGPVPANVILGPADDIRQEYLNSSILVSTSRYEGLPMVMLEAQAAGLPIVAFECKCGPRDIISDGEDGFLVPDGNIEQFCAKLLTLMCDKGRRQNMGQAAFKASERFDFESIMLRWQQLFDSLCRR